MMLPFPLAALLALGPAPGLAAGFPADAGIGRDPGVLFATGFEAADWRAEWTRVNARQWSDAVAADPAHRFAPLHGNALRVRLAAGELTALDTQLDLKRTPGGEPDEAFFRYYLRLGDDWDQTASGGKLPGLAGTSGRAGWGGRRSDGTNGWSARGYFGKRSADGSQPVGSYCYHADQKGRFGDVWVWAHLRPNRWYCVEQQVKLNAPDRADGVLRAWVDGRPAFERTGLRFRTTPDLKVQRVWLNVYHGGTTPAPHDGHLFLDNVVVARRYVGPLAAKD